MRRRPAALSLVLLVVAACASPASSSRPASSAPAAPLPTGGESYLVTKLDDARPGFGLRAVDGMVFSIRPATAIVTDGPTAVVEAAIAALP
jgi:hypothetical protein